MSASGKPLIVLMVGAMTLPAAAQATFPGRDGSIAAVNSEAEQRWDG